MFTQVLSDNRKMPPRSIVNGTRICLKCKESDLKCECFMPTREEHDNPRNNKQ